MGKAKGKGKINLLLSTSGINAKDVRE